MRKSVIVHPPPWSSTVGRMRCAALVSGGKDSIYAIHAARQLGHEIDVLVHVAPRGGEEEADSWMYQSAASAIVAATAERLMEIPLILHRAVRPPSFTEQLDYYEADVSSDEVGDLFDVLREAQKRYPQIAGVISGAIFSNYQRLRVERVCQLLGLTSLAPLWEQQQRPLLERMLEAGIAAIVVKVSSEGLDESHLGRTLNELHDYLIKLETRFGFHVCGEGGEFETLVLDAPMFKNRLEIKECDQPYVHDPSPVTPVLILRPKKYEIIPKMPVSPVEERHFVYVKSGRYYFDDVGIDLRDLPRFVNKIAFSMDMPEARARLRTGAFQPTGGRSGVLEVRELGPLLHQVSDENGESSTAPSQLRSILARLAASSEDFCRRDVVQVDLRLRSLLDLQECLTVLSSFFQGLPPPSCSCICVDTLSSELCRVEATIAVVDRKSLEPTWRRSNLHVQSLSLMSGGTFKEFSQVIYFRCAEGCNVVAVPGFSGVAGLVPHTGALPKVEEWIEKENLQFSQSRLQTVIELVLALRSVRNLAHSVGISLRHLRRLSIVLSYKRLGSLLSTNGTLRQLLKHIVIVLLQVNLDKSKCLSREAQLWSSHCLQEGDSADNILFSHSWSNNCISAEDTVRFSHLPFIEITPASELPYGAMLLLRPEFSVP